MVEATFERALFKVPPRVDCDNFRHIRQNLTAIFWSKFVEICEKLLKFAKICRILLKNVEFGREKVKFC